MTLIIVSIVVVVLLGVAWGGFRRGGAGDPQDLDPRTSRRTMDQQFKKPPNEGGLL